MVLTVVTKGVPMVEQNLHLLPVRFLHRAHAVEHESGLHVPFGKHGRELDPVVEVGAIVEGKQDVHRRIRVAVLVLEHPCERKHVHLRPNGCGKHERSRQHCQCRK